MKEDGALRKILRNEVTWFGTLFVVIWKIYTGIILPLNNLQIQATQIQSELNNQNNQYQTLSTAVNVLTTSVSVLKSRVDNLTKN